MFKENLIKLILAFLIFILILTIQPIDNILLNNTVASIFLIAFLWITEAIPLAVTSLIPIVLFPILGILDSKTTASQYINSTIFLFLGGFIIALAIEKHNLHKRIALTIIKLIGVNPKGILGGIIISTFLLSMFISNTAVTLMMLPIGLAIVKQISNYTTGKEFKTFSAILLLSIAYSSTIGGMATLIGTVPNLIFKSIYENTFTDLPKITFTYWIKFGLPISILLIISLYLLFTIKIRKIKFNIDKNLIKDQLKELGKIKIVEKIILIILFTTSVTWIFRENIELGDFTIYGWNNLFSFGKAIGDAEISIFFALLLFIIPTKNEQNEFETILDNNVFKLIPWDIILLFGGGYALAKGIDSSGLSQAIGYQFSFMKDINPFLLMSLVSISIIFLTEITSNVATVSAFLPILASISIAFQIDPILLMLPATIAASCAFMLPVATPPNAIVYSTGSVSIKDMYNYGFYLNLIASILLPAVFYLIYSI